MKNIKVAFILEFSDGWIGGINYYKNLLDIITENSDLNITPVLILPSNFDDNIIKSFLGINILKTKVLKKWSFFWLMNKLFIKIFNKGYCIESLLKKNKIDVVSHVGYDLCLSKIVQIPWIPDFQHKHLPSMFSDKELKYRDKSFGELSRFGKAVIVSSNDAKNDFENYFPQYGNKAKVLQFVVPFEKINYNSILLRKKYAIDGDFFFIPNQFWQHKNHKIVVEALTFLRELNIKVLCSGNTNDYRNRSYFSDLMDYVKQEKLENNFIVLGVIPYVDVQALMLECKALINPSLFEGWSTMVEEAKSIGKRIILSDLNVHKEQNPIGGLYFNRHDANELAMVMRTVWFEDDSMNINLMKLAKVDVQKRKRIEAESYRKILDSVVDRT
ncbi:glycosyltransferase [uncultured Phascolarctobacterium sp.]|uniref:glycosyltransferase n=1 Tax=Phascolarctobacterium sp. TaxID=2049039 RepID=UPI0025EB057B|nr:glycosyltransferase [uncultured Phascolarctobacterium sp.]